MLNTDEINVGYDQSSMGYTRRMMCNDDITAWHAGDPGEERDR